MKSYVFSTIAGACIIELVFEFLPMKADSGLKKYLRYIFSLVLALCIVVPLTNFAAATGGDIVSYFNVRDDAVSSPDLGYIYFENDSIVCRCSEQGIPEYSESAVADLYIKECCFSIISAAKSALCNKFLLNSEDISLGIAFDANDTSDIKIICAYVGVENSHGFLQSDVKDYTASLLGCKTHGLKF